MRPPSTLQMEGAASRTVPKLPTGTCHIEKESLMNPVASRLCKLRFFYILVALLGAFISIATAGCGGSVTQMENSTSKVTIVATSTGNDRLFQFSMTINSLTLTGKSGNVVDLMTTPLYVELVHLNGTTEPLVTASVPDGTYTAAAATIGTADFTCATTGPNGVLATGNFLRAPVPAANVTVNLPSPVQITGGNVILTLDLLVSQSASYSSCYGNGIQPFTASPTFSVSVAAVPGSQANPLNGKLSGLEGMIASVDSATNSFVVNSADGSNGGGADPANGPTWQVAFNGSTVFQGINTPSQLAVGLPVDMDAVLQMDGSLLATRIAVYDPDPTSTSLWVVPALFEDDSLGTVMLTGEKEQLGPVQGGDGAAIDFSNSEFEISQQLGDLANLPFHPGFTASNMVAGQNIEPTFHESSYGSSSMGPSPATVTLLPQTINGTVSAIGSEGGFTTYTITLAPYDLFPQLATQSGQTTLLTNPNTVVVYEDTNTQMLNTNPIAVGSVVRFYGLVFNDNGTLRMDCAKMMDGVAE